MNTSKTQPNKMKHYFLLFFLLLLLVGCKEEVPDPFEQFCGASTFTGCENNIDCVMTGCSGQICASKSDGNILGTCEYQECYDSKALNARCACVDSACQWRRA